jgi:hypothetical protein
VQSEGVVAGALRRILFVRRQETPSSHGLRSAPIAASESTSAGKLPLFTSITRNG